MVELYHISKSYGKQNVLTNFTYIFNHTGFYVISGPSGCGKTTLIDIIAGLTDFDTGEYYFNNVQIDGRKDQPYLHNTIAYIAQDTYFINYLTVQENLELVCNNKELLNKCIEEFQIQDLLEQYPITLSGGQRQKLAIIQALVSEKKVIVLDEPTSSLDEEGKHKIFELLKKISTDTLVICVTHDREVYPYADEIIDFMNLNLEDKAREIKEDSLCKKEAIYKENSLNHYTDQLRHYKKRETLSSKILFIVFSIFLLLVMSTYNIENKVVESMMERYHMNYLNVYVPIEQYDTFYNDLETNWDVNSVVYTYASGADYIKRPDCLDCVVTETEPYVRTLIYETIPTGDIFYYHDYLAYGSYFENAYEIMLGYEKAKELSSNIEKLIGKDIVIDTPKGKETFKITGIFKEFNEKEVPYFQNGFDTESINNNIYFNNKYTEQYKEDEIISSLEIANKKSEFVIYFNQPSQITEYIKQYGNLDNLMDDTSIVAKPVESYLFSLIQKVETILIVVYPCLIAALILVMLFYIQTKIFELHQSMNTLCVYLYYGYEWKTIIKAYRSYYFKEMIRITGSAACISIMFACMINLLDFTVYPIFTVSIPLVLFTACILGSVCYMNIKFILSRIKKNEWFSIMKERRDLL